MRLASREERENLVRLARRTGFLDLLDLLDYTCGKPKPLSVAFHCPPVLSVPLEELQRIARNTCAKGVEVTPHEVLDVIGKLVHGVRKQYEAEGKELPDDDMEVFNMIKEASRCS